MNSEQNEETWQIESSGHIVDTTFAEMTSLIDRGELVRIDRVRKGNLRWIEAGKVPSLMAVFNAKDGDRPLPPVITLTKLGPTTMPNPSSPPYKRGVAAASADGVVLAESAAGPVCSVHADIPAALVCTTCTSQFCKACPNSYGGTVKICPYCGAMCQPVAKVAEVKAQDKTYHAAVGNGFGFDDFTKALAYPFQFKTSLILGALMYAFFSVGQGSMGFGGIYMLGGALACFLMANTLTFGILSNTVENFTQGKIGENFMPSFDDFSVWDDVIQPFFLMIGVYVSSFGPLILLGIATFFFIAGAAGKEMNPVQSDAARLVNPELSYTAKAAKQSDEVKALLGKQQEVQKGRVESIEKGEMPTAPPVDDTEASVMRANEMIQQTQKAQAEAIIGKAPETKAKEQTALIQQVLGYGALFLLLGGICLVWGLFYFPAACAVAGYTQSFGATLNPTVGLDTIRRLGGDYFKILLMGLAMLIMSVVVSGILGAVFAAFDLPGMGNIPARAIGSLVGFYFSIVFACVIGFALFKASDRLKLPS